MSIIYSVVIPAFNEEELLPVTLKHLQHSMAKIDEDSELIVVDNNSSDRTAEIAKQFGAHVVFEAVNQISRARNAGAKMATGKYIIFIDADTLVDSTLIRSALDALDSGNYCGGGAKVYLDGELKGLPKLALDSWNWISRNLLLAAGCFIFCTKDGFEGTGGFSEKVYASEEIWFCISLRSWGRKTNKTLLIINESGLLSSRRKLDWYSQPELVFLTIALVVMPPLIFFRNFCPHWYRRKDKVSKAV